MIEIIEKIIPLVEGATNGAIWLVAAYFGLVALGYLLWFAAFAILARAAYLILNRTISLKSAKVNDWRIYRMETADGTEIRALFYDSELQDLLTAMASDTGFVHSSDVKRAIESIKGRPQ